MELLFIYLLEKDLDLYLKILFTVASLISVSFCDGCEFEADFKCQMSKHLVFNSVFVTSFYQIY